MHQALAQRNMHHDSNAHTRQQAVSDLRTLRDLAERLLQFDSVTFLQYLENVRVVEGGRSTWMFHSAAHIIFAEARRRVYRVAYEPAPGDKRKRSDEIPSPTTRDSAPLAGGDTDQQTSPTSAGIEPVLEPLPKWNLLLEVMEEIQEARAAAASRLLQPAATPQQRAADEVVATAPVVVFAQDAHTVAQLKQVLRAHSCTPLMTALYEHFLLQRLQGRRAPAAVGRGRYDLCCGAECAGMCSRLQKDRLEHRRGEAGAPPIRGKAPGEEQVDQ